MNQTNKNPVVLGELPVWSLLLQYAIPSVIAMTASSLYNIIDSIFIGQGVGALAIAGLAITFPLMNLGAAFGSLVGIGSATLMSLRLGQKDYVSANQILGNVFLLNLLFGVGYSIAGLIFLKPLLFFFGASNETMPYSQEYMQIILMGNVITHMFFGLNALLRASGNPGKSMIATLFSVLINVILTPIFIYPLHLGIRGAALATLIAQIVMLMVQIRWFGEKSHPIFLQKKYFRFKRKIIKETLSIGLAPFLLNAASCIIIIFINKGLILYGGDLHVGAYGIINRFVFLFLMVVMGINQGMQPIAGYNFGAGNIHRVNQVLKYSLTLGVGVLTAGFLVSRYFPVQVAILFTKDASLIELVAEGLGIVFIFSPLIGFQMVISNFFQSIGMVRKAILMSLSRQVLFLIPFLIYLPQWYGVRGVWYSLPAADFLAGIVAITLLYFHYRKTKTGSI